MTFRSALDAGQVLMGLCIMYPSPGVVERIGPDWDWVWIDAQHGELGYSDVLGLVRACDLIRRPAIVRVASHEFGAIGLALDTGAAGVIVPMVNSPDEAWAVVQAAKFPPLGRRSFGGRRPIDMHGRLYAETANKEILLIVQIETPEALEAADQIAAVPGVDALFLGPDDLMLRRGGRMDAPHSSETMQRDLAAIGKACRDNGKFGVVPGVGRELTKSAVSAGFQMIIFGGDVSFLVNASKQVSREAREVLNREPELPAPPPVSRSLY